MTAFEALAAASAGLVMVTGGTAVVVVGASMEPAPPRAVEAADARPLEVPGSVSVRPPADIRVVPVAGDGTGSGVTDAGSIPGAALAAYQRAAQVLSASDAACHLDWTLLAAIGRVESDHGRYGGSVLMPSGVSRPAIVGRALDGTGGTAEIPDSDAGELDGDTEHDRAVGAMQFIPSTWRLVGLDADGDGKRDPQDIDDSALAAGVYLCYGDEDLATPEGRAAAVHRYNRSSSYVDLVLRVMSAYAAGDFSPVVSGVSAQPVLARVHDTRPVAPLRPTDREPGPEPDDEPAPPDRDREPPREERPPRDPEPPPRPTPGPVDDEDVHDYVAAVEDRARDTLTSDSLERDASVPTAPSTP